jgi:hypothetical protein
MVFSERAATDRMKSDGGAPRPLWPYIALAVVIFAIGTGCAWTILTHDASYQSYLSRSSPPPGAATCALIRAKTNPKIPKSTAYQAPTPIGYTMDGRPIYPIVGYTSDGQPITADRAAGMQPITTRTNSMAIAALIAGWNFFPLGIIFGHIALFQIKRTGEGGRGFAIAGLVLGYLTLAAVAIVAIIIAANL